VKLTPHPYLAQRLFTLMTPMFEEGQIFFLTELTVTCCKYYQQYRMDG